MNDKAIAKTLSVLFHPILYPIYGFLLLFFLDGQFIQQINIQAKLYVLAVVFINNVLLPFALLYILKKRKFISSIQLENRTERFYPLLIGLLFYVSSWYLISRLPLPQLYSYVLFLSAFLSVLAIIANLFFKISLHSLGAAGFSTALLAVSYVYNQPISLLVVIAILISGLIGSSRLVLKAHQDSQVYTGLLIGFIIGWISIIYLY